MKKQLIWIAAFWIATTTAFGAAFAAPRLLVVVVVDQMQVGYLAPSTPTYTGGLARLQREGFVYTAARHVHVPTETGPGHAAILTGAYMADHGIAGNNWFDVRSGSVVYCVDDAVHGVGPEHLRSYTLGDALKAHDPDARVVTVSIKDRAAVLLGGKRADLALWYDSDVGEFRTSSYYGRSPKWLARFNEKLKGDGGPLHSATTGYWDRVKQTPEADRMTLRLALEAVKRQGLGRDDHPDILAISFSGTDYIGHRYGPHTPEMTAQLASLDKILGELLDALDRRVGRGRYALALTADHGAHPEPSLVRRVSWEELEGKLERALQFEYPARQKWIVDYEFPAISLNRALAASMGLEWTAFLRHAASKLRTVDGVAGAYVPGISDPADPFDELYARSVVPGRSGDLMLRPEPDALILGAVESDTHGSPYDYDTHVPLIFWGEAFAAGASSESVRVIDLAPTAGRALGVTFMPEPDSRVLPAFK